MMSRMSFRNLKASFSKQARKQQLHHCDFVRSNSSNANGVMENKDQRSDSDCLDSDQKHCSVALKLRKHENKKNKEGLWKTLRKKLSRNRRKCRDRNEPHSQSDDSDQGHSFTSGNRVGTETSKAKSNSFSSDTPFRFQKPNSNSDRYDLDETEDALLNYGISSKNVEILSESDVENKCKNHSITNNMQVNGKQLEVLRGNHYENSIDYSVSSPVSNNKFSDTSSAANYHHSLVPNNHDTFSLLDQSVNSEEFYLCETPKKRSLTKELKKLSYYGWYWGPITRTEAEEKLLDQPDGAFLVRDSSDDRHLLSLSFRSYGKTLHTRIEHCNGLFSFYAQPEPEGHTSIVDLIEHSMSYSQSGIFCYSRARSPGAPSFPVRLTKPVSRFTHVRTLKYLCRFIIRQNTRFDHIQKLPLPNRLKDYIEEGHF